MWDDVPFSKNRYKLEAVAPVIRAGGSTTVATVLAVASLASYNLAS